MNTTDVAEAKSFYGEVFDWKLTDVLMPDGAYTMIEVGEGTGGGLMKHPIPGAPSIWLAYVLVDDVKAATGQAKSLGGTILKDVTEVPGRGCSASSLIRPVPISEFGKPGRRSLRQRPGRVEQQPSRRESSGRATQGARQYRGARPGRAGYGPRGRFHFDRSNGPPEPGSMPAPWSFHCLAMLWFESACSVVSEAERRCGKRNE